MKNIRVKYNTFEFDNVDIHVKTLRDNQEYSDKNSEQLDNYGISPANWSLFGIIWPASKVLAYFMQNYNTENKRILELGCGIALTSHLLNSKNANITATDYHPEAESFLEYNVKLNNCDKIPFERTCWGDEDDHLGKFDLIVGSDVLYERWHIEELSNFINNHANEECEIIIVDPGRGNHAKFTKSMNDLGFTHIQFKARDTEQYLTKVFKGQLIKYTR